MVTPKQIGILDPIDSTPLPTPEEDQDNKPANAVKVFSYACKIAYPEEAAHVEHQLTLTHRHRNLLTETLLKGREKLSHRKGNGKHEAPSVDELGTSQPTGAGKH